MELLNAGSGSVPMFWTMICLVSSICFLTVDRRLTDGSFMKKFYISSAAGSKLVSLARKAQRGESGAGSVSVGRCSTIWFESTGAKSLFMAKALALWICAAGNIAMKRSQMSSRKANALRRE